jgi:RNA polymerase sigma-70 factor (ECF subfamily)
MVASADLTESSPGSAWDGEEPMPAQVAPQVGRSKDEPFRTLYDAHFKRVWSALRRLGVREPDVMDLTQKVFFTAYTKLDEFEGRSRISTWLYGICQRVASDHRRSAAVRREVATDASELDIKTAVPDADDDQQRQALAEAILNKLPEAQRSVFVLFELEELTGVEIAEILEIPVGTVRSRLRLARETFAREVRRLSASERAPKERT